MLGKLDKPAALLLRLMRKLASFSRKMKRPHTTKSTWNDRRSKPCNLKLINKCPYKIDVFWIDYHGNLQPFDSVKPGRAHTISTFTTHPWHFQPADGRTKPVWRYMGGSAVLHLLPNGELVTKQHAKAQHQADDRSWVKSEWGQYKERGSVAGMPIMAYDCVSNEAVSALACCISHMTATMRPDVRAKMGAAGCKLAIIGRHQVTTDIPEHHFMCREAEDGGRDIDGTTRGLGATTAIPTCSCGEENLTMVDDKRYPEESILVHEFAHAVMNLGFSDQDRSAIRMLYRQAQQQQLYDPECYMMENADEYWAEASQVWFGATVRTDVTSGITNRQLLQQHDPGLAQLLLQVYGNNTWRYTDTCPAAFKASRHNKRKHQ